MNRYARMMLLRNGSREEHERKPYEREPMAENHIGFYDRADNVTYIDKANSEDRMNRAIAEKWMRGIENSDGTHGAHWTLEQTTQVMQQRGLSYNPVCFWVAMNAIYSDFGEVLEKHGITSLDVYSDMAAAFWLDDVDAVKEKEAAYWKHIVKH